MPCQDLLHVVFLFFSILQVYGVRYSLIHWPVRLFHLPTNWLSGILKVALSGEGQFFGQVFRVFSADNR